MPADRAQILANIARRIMFKYDNKKEKEHNNNNQNNDNRFGTGHVRPVVSMPTIKVFNFTSDPSEAIASVGFFCRTDYITAVVTDLVAADLLWIGSSPLAVYADYLGVEKMVTEDKKPAESVLAFGGLTDTRTGDPENSKHNNNDNIELKIGDRRLTTEEERTMSYKELLGVAKKRRVKSNEGRRSTSVVQSGATVSKKK